MEIYLNRDVTIAMEFTQEDVKDSDKEDIPRPSPSRDDDDFGIELKQEDGTQSGVNRDDNLNGIAAIRRNSLTIAADNEPGTTSANRTIMDDKKYQFEPSAMDGDQSVNSQGSDMTDTTPPPELESLEAMTKHAQAHQVDMNKEHVL